MTDSPDAVLLKLGQQLEAAWSELQAPLARFSFLHDEVEAAALEASPDLPERQEDWSSEDTERYCDALRDADLAAGEPYHAAEAAKEAAFKKCDLLCKAIAAITPIGIAGAGVRARAAMYAASHWWDKPGIDLDWPEHQSRLLIEALCDAAGLPNAPAGAAMQAQGNRDEKGRPATFH